MNITGLLLSAATLAIILNGLRLITVLDHTKWTGHQAHFFVVVLSYAGICTGMLGLTGHWEAGGPILAVSIAAWLCVDRRR